MKTYKIFRQISWALVLLNGHYGWTSENSSFPKGFAWCAATAAHQIEGGNSNSDWWEWETSGHTRSGDRSGAACDDWNRYAEDVQLLKDLGVTRYRLSVEWARIEPTSGHFDLQALRHYKDEIILLRKAGISPLVTLHHFTLPLWFAKNGGWEWEGAPAVFARYVTAVRDALEDEVQDWITFNEPSIFLSLGYLDGKFPPGKKDAAALGRALTQVMKSHALAYHILHDGKVAQSGKKIRVGLANAVLVLDPKISWSPIDKLLAHSADKKFNWAIPESLNTGVLKFSIPFQVSINLPIQGLQGAEDFFGLNYYTRNLVGFSFSAPHFISIAPVEALDSTHRSDLGWEIYPEGFYRAMKTAHELKPDLPIMITENGIADAEDSRRKDFVTSHLQQVLRAIQDKIPVEGYCYWSLLDNFEWNDGFSPRFGLYKMDYATQKRTLRPSGIFYGEVIKKNSL